MDSKALRARYQSYIDCLNERQFDRLDDYVAERVIYNGLDYKLDDYRNMIVSDTTAIPDLWFNIRLLVVENDHVAARLDFKCTPQREFLGFHANGTLISFAEHVFYHFCHGKITEVWSLIDRHAIEKQLGPSK